MVKEAAQVPLDKYVTEISSFLGRVNTSALQLYQLQEQTVTHIADKIQRELRRAPEGLNVVYIATDDPTMRKKLQQRLGPSVDIREQPRLDDAKYNSSAVGQSETA